MDEPSALAPQAPPPFKDLVKGLEQRGDFGLQVFQGASEFVVGAPQRIPFRLDDDEATIETGTARIWLGRANTVTDPFDMSFTRFGAAETDDEASTGFWEVLAPMPGTGVIDIAVESVNAGRTLYGFAVIESRATPVVPAVRDQAVKVATPTAGNLLDASVLCTKEPPCDMHSVSLDSVLGSSKPVVLTIGSPKLCSSGVCGPVVDEVVALRASGVDAHFIHVEPYKGSTATELTAAASAWRLPSEPWTFIIDGRGQIVARFEGPIGLKNLNEGFARIT